MTNTPLDTDSLLDLYSYHRFDDTNRHKGYIDERKEILTEMFNRVENHTLMIELLAKLPMKSGLNEYEIHEYLSSGLNISPAKVGIIKDGKDIEDTAKVIIKKIFSISQLDDAEKNIMRHMALVPFSGMELSSFKDLAGYAVEEIIPLKENNWIVIDEETFRIRLHPLICETILDMDETRPSCECCDIFLTNLNEKLEGITPDNHFFSDLNKTMAICMRKILFSQITDSPCFRMLKKQCKDSLFYLDGTLKE